MENKSDTEKRILNAAIKIFQEKGFDGTRMQEIADEAVINKSLLHYYFRSKDKLFEAVFTDAFIKFIPKISLLIASDLPLKEKIARFVESYFYLLTENPHLPHFVFHEVFRNPSKMISLIREAGIRPELFYQSIQKEIDAGFIRPVDPKDLIVNILAMCIFPFIGQPVIQGFLFQNDAQQYKMFLEERKKTVVDFVISSIYIK